MPPNVYTSAPDRDTLNVRMTALTNSNMLVVCRKAMIGGPWTLECKADLPRTSDKI